MESMDLCVRKRTGTERHTRNLCKAAGRPVRAAPSATPEGLGFCHLALHPSRTSRARRGRCWVAPTRSGPEPSHSSPGSPGRGSDDGRDSRAPPPAAVVFTARLVGRDSAHSTVFPKLTSVGRGLPACTLQGRVPGLGELNGGPRSHARSAAGLGLEPAWLLAWTFPRKPELTELGCEPRVPQVLFSFFCV